MSHSDVSDGTVARQAPLSLGFSRQEYRSGLPCPPPGHLPDPGLDPGSPVSGTWREKVAIWKPRREVSGETTPVAPHSPPAPPRPNLCRPVLFMLSSPETGSLLPAYPPHGHLLVSTTHLKIILISGHNKKNKYFIRKKPPLQMSPSGF